MKQRILWTVAAVLWAGIIFVLSNLPDLATDLSSLADLILRKGAHLTEYVILAFLVHRALGTKSRWWLVVLLCVLYAASDEWHQTFVQDRHGAPLDVGIDAVGVLLGTFLALRTEKSSWQKA